MLNHRIFKGTPFLDEPSCRVPSIIQKGKGEVEPSKTREVMKKVQQQTRL